MFKKIYYLDTNNYNIPFSTSLIEEGLMEILTKYGVNVLELSTLPELYRSFLQQ